MCIRHENNTSIWLHQLSLFEGLRTSQSARHGNSSVLLVLHLIIESPWCASGVVEWVKVDIVHFTDPLWNTLWNVEAWTKTSWRSRAQPPLRGEVLLLLLQLCGQSVVFLLALLGRWADLGFSWILHLDPKSNHIDFKLPLKEWKWSHAMKRTRDSRFQPQENISKGCGDNDRDIFGSENGAPKSSGNFIVFPLTWQLLGFYTWSPKDPNCRHVLPARSIFHGSGHEHCCLMVCFTQWKSWNNQRQR